MYVSDSVVHKDNVASKAKELILDLGWGRQHCLLGKAIYIYNMQLTDTKEGNFLMVCLICGSK